ncbi:unnamed protein product [Litomosoides sigmodontis]|uniref:Uncharacterized protein n=1 Tax=Litomosoides sigmodontis TaxID=42156 RepID=A0A3P6SPU4_LITSI|nr:unnamed protein product [Litomosoides sigmodontis]
MADLAEAVVRGDILVDEIDVIEAVQKGRLSASDGARFSTIMEEYSKLHGKSAQSNGECVESAQEASPKSTKWDEILVDEMDFIEALKTGRISKDDCHIASINKGKIRKQAVTETFEDSSGDLEESKISFHDNVVSDDGKMSDELSSVDIHI